MRAELSAIAPSALRRDKPRPCVPFLQPAISVVLALVLSLAGAAQQAPLPESCPGDYVIGPEDVLDVAVWNNTEITRTVPVRPDGKISLPLLNDIQAAGLTPMQLRESLAKALTSYIPTPAVSVLVREVHSFKVSVIGQVKTPGRYELKGRATVLDVLAMAGGLTEYAARGRIVVFRQDGAATRQIPFPYDRLVSNNGSKPTGAENFCVRPSDIVLVP
jgi:polysaccharide biosynthesis/export protein